MNSILLLSGLALLIIPVSDIHCIEQVHNMQFSQVRKEEERKHKICGHLGQREHRAPERHGVLIQMQTPLGDPHPLKEELLHDYALQNQELLSQLQYSRQPRCNQYYTKAVPTGATSTQSSVEPTPDITFPAAPAEPAAPINRGLLGPDTPARANITIALAQAASDQPSTAASPTAVSPLPQTLAPLPGEPQSITPKETTPVPKLTDATASSVPETTALDRLKLQETRKI